MPLAMYGLLQTSIARKKLEKDEAEVDYAFYERFEGAWNEDFHALQYDNSSQSLCVKQCKLHTN